MDNAHGSRQTKAFEESRFVFFQNIVHAVSIFSSDHLLFDISSISNASKTANNCLRRIKWAISYFVFPFLQCLTHFACTETELFTSQYQIILSERNKFGINFKESILLELSYHFQRDAQRDNFLFGRSTKQWRPTGEQSGTKAIENQKP